jgi:8-amino-7-oxononanoate synthase
MSKGSNMFGLSPEARAILLKQASGRRTGAEQPEPPRRKQGPRAAGGMANLPGQHELQAVVQAAETLGIANPYFRVHDGIAGAETVIEGRRYDNFASYNYLGLNGDPRIAAAATEAIGRYGTSVSASRLVSGERPVHRALEQGLAALYGAEDCLCFVSGHATNVTVIGQIMKADDLVLHDELVHNSIVQGAVLSTARRFTFRHNDVEAARQLLETRRGAHGRALIVIEGHYSMDGDIPDLPAFIELARRHDCWLMVDEAHSLGVLGLRGYGLAEHFGIDPSGVDLWMGTLSKTLASCGGYIAGRHALIDYLKHAAPGFVFSVGLAPPMTAAALAALGLMLAEPERVARLRRNAAHFLSEVKAAGLDAGTSIGAGIVPVVTRSSIRAARLAEAMFRRSVNVQPILYPAVPERGARLRFFISAAHSDGQITRVAAILREEMGRLT